MLAAKTADCVRRYAALIEDLTELGWSEWARLIDDVGPHPERLTKLIEKLGLHVGHENTKGSRRRLAVACMAHACWLLDVRLTD